MLELNRVSIVMMISIRWVVHSIKWVVGRLHRPHSTSHSPNYFLSLTHFSHSPTHTDFLPLSDTLSRLNIYLLPSNHSSTHSLWLPFTHSLLPTPSYPIHLTNSLRALLETPTRSHTYSPSSKASNHGCPPTSPLPCQKSFRYVHLNKTSFV